MKGCLAACGAIGASILFAGVALAQDATPPAKQLILQLNNTETIETGCQLYFAAQNDTDTGILRSTFQVAVIDAASRVSQLIVFRFNQFPIGVTKVESLVLPDRKCEDVSGLLINEVKECIATDETATRVCEDQMEQSSNTTIQFPWRLKR